MKVLNSELKYSTNDLKLDLRQSLDPFLLKYLELLVLRQNSQIRMTFSVSGRPETGPSRKSHDVIFGFVSSRTTLQSTALSNSGKMLTPILPSDWLILQMPPPPFLHGLSLAATDVQRNSPPRLSESIVREPTLFATCCANFHCAFRLAVEGLNSSSVAYLALHAAPHRRRRSRRLASAVVVKPPRAA